MPEHIREDCPCKKTGCSRHTLCDQCEDDNRSRNRIPFCRRPRRSLFGRIRRWFGFR